jgi:hypothetical protein
MVIVVAAAANRKGQFFATLKSCVRMRRFILSFGCFEPGFAADNSDNDR